MNDTLPLPQQLADQVGARATGILTATSGRLKRLFCLRKGRLIYAASNLIEEQFDEVLVKAGKLSPTQRAHLRVDARKAGVTPSKQLETSNLMTSTAFGEALRAHFLELLSQSLDDLKTKASFAIGTPNLETEATADISGFPSVLQGLTRHPTTLNQVRVAIGPPKTVVCLSATAMERLQEEEVPRELLEWVINFNEPRNVSHWVEAGSMKAETAYRQVLALLTLGILERVVEETAESARGPARAGREELEARFRAAGGADHYGVLGIKEDADESKIREAYYYLARRLHPDLLRGRFGDLLSQIESYFSRVTAAYNTLVNTEDRELYDSERKSTSAARRRVTEQEPSFLARQNFTRAKQMVERNRRSDAVVFLENACKLDPKNGEYPRELGKLLAGNPRHRAEAETLLLKAIEFEPVNAANYSALGQLYVRMNRPDEARKQFKEALNWNPNNAEAQLGLQELNG